MYLQKASCTNCKYQTICPFTLTVSWWINTTISELHMQAPTEYFSGNVKCWFCCLVVCCLCMMWTFVFSECLSCNPDEVSGRSGRNVGIFMKNTKGWNWDVPHQLANQTSGDVFLCHQDRSYIVFWGLQVWESVENSLVSQLRVFQDDPVQQKYTHTLNIGIPGSPYSLIWRSCHDYRGLLLPVNSRNVHSRLMTHLTLVICMDSLLKCMIAR